MEGNWSTTRCQRGLWAPYLRESLPIHPRLEAHFGISLIHYKHLRSFAFRSTKSCKCVVSPEFQLLWKLPVISPCGWKPFYLFGPLLCILRLFTLKSNVPKRFYKSRLLELRDKSFDYNLSGVTNADLYYCKWRRIFVFRW